jgi:hypothetical protein
MMMMMRRRRRRRRRRSMRGHRVDSMMEQMMDSTEPVLSGRGKRVAS